MDTRGGKLKQNRYTGSYPGMRFAYENNLNTTKLWSFTSDKCKEATSVSQSDINMKSSPTRLKGNASSQNRGSTLPCLP